MSTTRITAHTPGLPPVKIFFVLLRLLALALLLIACTPTALTENPSETISTPLTVPPTIAETQASSSITAPSPMPQGLAPTEQPVSEMSTAAITAENAERVIQLKQLGRGTLNGSPAYSADGSLLAIPTTVGVDFYDAASLEHLRTLAKDTPTTMIALSPDGRILAEAVWGAVRLWDIASGAMVGELSVDVQTEYYFTDLKISPGGSLLAAAFGLDRKIQVWQLPGGNPLYKVSGDAIQFSPDERYLAAVQHPSPPAVYLYDAVDGSLLRQWDAEEAVFSPDGSLAVVSAGALRLIDPQTGKARLAFSGSRPAFSLDGQKLALFSNSAVEVYQLPEGDLLRRIEWSDSVGGSFNGADALVFSPDGGSLAGMMSFCAYPGGCAYDNQGGFLWRLSDGALIAPAKDEKIPAYLMFTPNSQELMLARSDGVDFVGVADGSFSKSLGDYVNPVAGIAFSPDGRLLAGSSGGYVLSVRIWDTISDEVVQRLIDPGSGSEYLELPTAFSPDGRLLAVRGSIWRMPAGELWTSLKDKVIAEHSFWADSVAFSPDGNLLALGFVEGQVQVWELVDERLVFQQGGEPGYVASLSFSPDGNTLSAAYRLVEPVIRLWSLPEEGLLHTFSDHFFSAAMISPDGESLYALADQEELVWGGSLLRYSLPGGEELYATEPHNAISLAISPDGSLVATGSTDGTIRLWRADDGSMLHVLNGHTNYVPALAFSPDGSLLASASLDGTIRLWSLP